MVVKILTKFDSNSEVEIGLNKVNDPQFFLLNVIKT